jgi:hypothetical protein
VVVQPPLVQCICNSCNSTTCNSKALEAFVLSSHLECSRRPPIKERCMHCAAAAQPDIRKPPLAKRISTYFKPLASWSINPTIQVIADSMSHLDSFIHSFIHSFHEGCQ